MNIMPLEVTSNLLLFISYISNDSIAGGCMNFLGDSDISPN
jgi:hypothetical protein